MDTLPAEMVYQILCQVNNYLLVRRVYILVFNLVVSSEYEIDNIKQSGGAYLLEYGGRLHKTKKNHWVNVHYKLSLYHTRMGAPYPLPYDIYVIYGRYLFFSNCNI